MKPLQYLQDCCRRVWHHARPRPTRTEDAGSGPLVQWSQSAVSGDTLVQGSAHPRLGTHSTLNKPWPIFGRFFSRKSERNLANVRVEGISQKDIVVQFPGLFPNQPLPNPGPSPGPPSPPLPVEQRRNSPSGLIPPHDPGDTVHHHQVGAAPPLTGCCTQRRHFRQHETRLQLGLNRKLCRWLPNSILEFLFDYASFPNEAVAAVIHTHFVEAIRIWTQGPGINLSIHETRDRSRATFRVAWTDREFEPGDVAMAFFPSEKGTDRTLHVYPPALDNMYKDHLTSVFCHELGHVIGLRHEFAEEEYWQPSVMLGRENRASIMTYPRNPQQLAAWRVQDQDLAEVRKYMALTGGQLRNDITGLVFPMTDFAPTPMSKRQDRVKPGGNSERRHVKEWRYCCFNA